MNWIEILSWLDTHSGAVQAIASVLTLVATLLLVGLTAWYSRFTKEQAKWSIATIQRSHRLQDADLNPFLSLAETDFELPPINSLPTGLHEGAGLPPTDITLLLINTGGAIFDTELQIISKSNTSSVRYRHWRTGEERALIHKIQLPNNITLPMSGYFMLPGSAKLLRLKYKDKLLEERSTDFLLRIEHVNWDKKSKVILGAELPTKIRAILTQVETYDSNRISELS